MNHYLMNLKIHKKKIDKKVTDAMSKGEEYIVIEWKFIDQLKKIEISKLIINE